MSSSSSSPRQAKRISAKDALSHPYLDEGRLRYHTCMCTCCFSVSSGRVYTSDFEPRADPKFDGSYEKNLTSVWQVKGSCCLFLMGAPLRTCRDSFAVHSRRQLQFFRPGQHHSSGHSVSLPGTWALPAALEEWSDCGSHRISLGSKLFSLPQSSHHPPFPGFFPWSFLKLNVSLVLSSATGAPVEMLPPPAP